VTGRPSRAGRLSRVGALALTSVLLGIGATACASTPEPDPDQDTTSAAERFATPLELARARTECLQEKGWESELDEETGQIRTPVDDGDDQAFDEDDAACFEELGVDPDRSLTSAEFDTLYEQYLEGKDCLEGAGHAITDPPSRQVFEETYDSDAWVPWTEVGDEAITEALEACPMPPPVY